MLQWLSLLSILLVGLALTGWDDLHPHYTEGRNDKILAVIAEHTEQFIKEHNRTPYSSSELRSWIKRQGDLLTTLYDVRGNAIHYIRFNQSQYLLRALGSDEQEDTIAGRDDSIVARVAIPAEAKVTYPGDGPFYPHLNLLGSRFGTMMGWITTDRERQQKKLILRCQDNPQLVMTAPHRLVDEFMWLRGGDSLVYTASDHGNTGIYLWNYGSGKVKLLNPQRFRSQEDSAKADTKVYIALKSYDPHSRTLRFYRMASRSETIDPADFYSERHEQIFKFGPKYRRFSHAMELSAKPLITASQPRKAPQANGPIEPRPLNSGFVVKDTNAREEVQEWSALKTSGPVSEVLDDWQRYSIAHTASAIYPYSLWGLSTIYGQAHHIYQSRSIEGAKQLRRYGMQVSLALSNMTLAPPYLRAFAAFNFQQLGDSKPPSFPLATVTADPAAIDD